MARCEAGAYYNERGRITYECEDDATFQAVMNGEDLLVVWCTEHMRENVADFLTTSPNVRIEPWSGE